MAVCRRSRGDLASRGRWVFAMTWLTSFVIVLVVGAIAAAVHVIRQRKTVAHDDYRFHSARTIDAEPSEFSHGWGER